MVDRLGIYRHLTALYSEGMLEGQAMSVHSCLVKPKQYSHKVQKHPSPHHFKALLREVSPNPVALPTTLVTYYSTRDSRPFSAICTSSPLFAPTISLSPSRFGKSPIFSHSSCNMIWPGVMSIWSEPQRNCHKESASPAFGMRLAS